MIDCRALSPFVAASACAALLVLAGCASPMAEAPRRVQADLPPLPAVAPEEMFATAIDEICFEALARSQTPHQRIAYLDFIETDSAAEMFRSTPADTLFRARDVSSPVLVSLAPDEARCDVIAVRGNPADLRKAAEGSISRFDQRGLTGIADYLSAIDRSPRYAMKFTLRYAGMVGDPDGLEDAEQIRLKQDGEAARQIDPFAITE